MIFDAITNIKWKGTIEKNAKNTKLQFWPNLDLMLSKPSAGISMEIKNCCNKNSDEESTFNIHITWTQDKVKGANV